QFQPTLYSNSNRHRLAQFRSAGFSVLYVRGGELVWVFDVNVVEQVSNHRGGHWVSPLSNVLQSGFQGRVPSPVLGCALELPPAALAAVVAHWDGSKDGRKRSGLGKTKCPPVLRVSFLQADSRPTGRCLTLLVVLAVLHVPLCGFEPRISTLRVDQGVSAHIIAIARYLLAALGPRGVRDRRTRL